MKTIAVLLLAGFLFFVGNVYAAEVTSPAVEEIEREIAVLLKLVEGLQEPLAILRTKPPEEATRYLLWVQAILENQVVPKVESLQGQLQKILKSDMSKSRRGIRKRGRD